MQKGCVVMSNRIPYNQVPLCPGGTVYTIKPGDSYYSLAKRFNTTVKALILANPGVNPNNLQIGQQICIPVAPTPTPCPGGFQYINKPGDTYYSIAKKYNVTVDALIAANPGVNPNNLQVGQTICVPNTPPMPCPGGRFYTIVAGDTLYSLAKKFNTTVDAIIAANPGINPYNLQVGQVICIP
jgi:peptidoglycan endopeptidase LytF